MRLVTASFICLIIGGLSYYAHDLRSTNLTLEEELEFAAGFQKQTQELAALSTRRRLEFEETISEMEASLLEMRTELSNLAVALQRAQEQANPEYERLLEQARLEIAANESAESLANNRGAAFAMFSNPDISWKIAKELTASKYQEFLSAADIELTEKRDLLESIATFYSERYQMLSQLIAGNLASDQAAAYFGPNAMIDNLSYALTEEQREILRLQSLQFSKDDARRAYSATINPTGVEETSAEVILDTVLDELFSAENNFGALVGLDGSMRNAYNRKLQALDRAKNRLEGDVSASQMDQLNQLVDNLTGTVDILLETSEDSSGALQVRNMRIGADSLPN